MVDEDSKSVILDEVENGGRRSRERHVDMPKIPAPTTRMCAGGEKDGSVISRYSNAEDNNHQAICGEGLGFQMGYPMGSCERQRE